MKREKQVECLSKILKEKPPKKERGWATGRIVFLGAEHYVLGFLDDVEFQIDSAEGGFVLRTKDKVAVPAERFMGPHIRRVVLQDIELELPGFSMSLGVAYPNTFPRTFREGDTIGLK